MPSFTFSPAFVQYAAPLLNKNGESHVAKRSEASTNRIQAGWLIHTMGESALTGFKNRLTESAAEQTILISPLSRV